MPETEVMIQQKVRKKNICFNVRFQYSESKIMEKNKMTQLKSLAMLKYESRNSLHAVQYR